MRIYKQHHVKITKTEPKKIVEMYIYIHLIFLLGYDMIYLTVNFIYLERS